MEKSKEGIVAISRILFKYPFFGSILFKTARYVETDDPKIPYAATDGRSIYFNREWVKKIPTDWAVFVICHEVLHNVYRHINRSADYRRQGHLKGMKWSDKLANIAQDYIINDVLKEAKVGIMPDFGLWDQSIGTADDSFEDVYARLYKQYPPQDSDGDGGSNPKQGRYDEHLSPAEDTPTEQDVKSAIASAIRSCKQAGQALPGSIERLFGKILEPQIPWQEELRNELVMRIGTDNTTWRKLNRRKLVSPGLVMKGKCGYATGAVVIILDTSGSISTEIPMFLGEVSGILNETHPEHVYLLWVDSDVRHVDEPEPGDDLTLLTAHGGGGTDMGAGFKWCADNDIVPSCVVVLTDMYTPFPNAPSYPSIWVTPTTGVKAPFGKTIVIKEDRNGL